MSGKWSGGSANRSWNKPGRYREVTNEDLARGLRLFRQMDATPFFCETCGTMHPLAEHQACRELDAATPNVIAEVVHGGQ